MNYYRCCIGSLKDKESSRYVELIENAVEPNKILGACERE
jgi:hypothetical protein